MIPDVVSPMRGREEAFLDAPWIPVTPLFSGHIKRWSLMSFTASFITGGGGPLIHVTVTSDAPNLGLTPGFYWTVAGDIRLRKKIFSWFVVLWNWNKYSPTFFCLSSLSNSRLYMESNDLKLVSVTYFLWTLSFFRLITVVIRFYYDSRILAIHLSR